MKSIDALREVAELSAAQWGLFTAAQALARGVDRVTLARLADAGQIVRVAHGVYRTGGAPRDQFEALRAAWLSIHPTLLAEQRVGKPIARSTPASGTTAAELHGIGDLYTGRLEFTTPVRRQSQRPDLRYRIRRLDSGDVAIREGLPVTALERTIADLVEQRHALSHVANAVRDAAGQRALDEKRLVTLLSPLAARHGCRRGDGAALWGRLSKLAGTDAETAATEIANHEVLGPLVITRMLGQSPVREAKPEPARTASRASSVGAVISSPAYRQVTRSARHG